LVSAIQAAQQPGRAAATANGDGAGQRVPAGAGRDLPNRGTEASAEALRQDVVNARLSQAGLPAPVTRRLAAASYESAEQLGQAIEAARQELAELAEADVVNIGGQAPRSRVSGMRTGVDRVAAAVDW